MNTVCAWCGEVLREEPGEGISHGVCAACYQTLAEELENPLLEPETEEFPRDAGESLWEMWIAYFRFSIVANGMAVILLLASHILHFLTNGWFPDLIQWLVELPLR